MKLFLYAIAGILFIYAIYLCSASVLSRELVFTNDVARDFLLLQELDAKKIVFIGPRSNTQGLFHGPLWTYINYPAYLIGNGNPVVVAWFWILLVIVFLFTSFLIAKKLFGTFPALIYALLLSVKLVPHVNGIFHAEATIFVMPIFFFTIYQYLVTKKNIYLIAHLIATAVITQLNIGVGIQFIMLSSALILFIIIKNKLWKHLLSFVTLPIFLSNFIIFDIKHNFQMAKALLGTGGASKFFITISSWIQNRIENTYSLQLFENPDKYQNFLMIVFLLVIACSILLMKNYKKERSLYSLFLFYYLGYMVLSYFNKSVILFHYVYLLIPLIMLWLVSFLKGKYKAVFIVVVAIVYVINFQYAIDYANTFKSPYIGTAQDSWRGLSNVAQKVVEMQKAREFGYYVFAPDAFAYQPRYALDYNFKKANAKAYEYEKKDTTLVIAQAPPANDPYMDYKWWVKVPVKITNEPVKIVEFPNGYKVLEYKLTAEEQKIPHDKTIELGIHFR